MKTFTPVQLLEEELSILEFLPSHAISKDIKKCLPVHFIGKAFIFKPETPQKRLSST
jgi:hypothetical protein